MSESNSYKANVVESQNVSPYIVSPPENHQWQPASETGIMDRPKGRF